MKNLVTKNWDIHSRDVKDKNFRLQFSYGCRNYYYTESGYGFFFSDYVSVSFG